jgi:hypothetical protein
MPEIGLTKGVREPAEELLVPRAMSAASCFGFKSSAPLFDATAPIANAFRMLPSMISGILVALFGDETSWGM